MRPVTVTILLLTSVLLLWGHEVRADPPPGGDRDDLTYEGAAGELNVATPRIEDPRIDVDARLSEADWDRAARLTDFTQFRPSEGIPASQRTEILVFVSRDALYLGIRAFDSEPDRIRATLTERDDVRESDDYVRFTLDTFDAQRQAYVIMVNPLGVQQDGIWVEGGGDRRRGGFGPPVDYNLDLIWESAGRIEDWGWSAEIRIPFKSLRFPQAEVQAWGFQALRNIERTGFQESWAPLSADVSNQLAQAGRLQELEDLDPGLFLELNPVATARRLGTVDPESDRFETRDPEAEFGGNATYGLTSNLTLDATFNPDFSQVEADAGQISVNERFALFFPEKRPFFLEGTEIFTMAQRLVHTRRITDPIAGAKITGKVGGLQLGYLGAVDETDQDERGDAVANLFRLKKDVGETSSLGALYTDRTRGSDDFNRVAAVDARLLFGPRYTLELLGAGSWTSAPGASGTESGSLLHARLERSGRELSFNASLEDVHPGFVTRSGFLRRTGDAQVSGELEYTFWGPPGHLVENVTPSVEFRGFWDHHEFWRGGGLEEGELELGTRVSFRNQITLSLSGSRNVFDIPPAAYDGLFVEDPGGELEPFVREQDPFSGLYGIRLFGFFSMWESLGGRLRMSWSESPIFERRRDVPVEVADLLSLDWNFNLKPTRALSAELGIRHETLWRQADGTRFSTATIPRIRAQYQFTRAVFLRGIAEVASQEREAIVDPDTGRPLLFCDGGECQSRAARESHDIHVEALLSYEPSPGTVVFVGYVRDMEDSGAFRFRDTRPRSEGIFAKVSYRFRF